MAPAEKNRVDRVTHVSIDPSGAVSGDISVFSSGHGGEATRYYLDGKTREEMTKYIHDYFADRAIQFEVDSCRSANLDSIELPVILSAHLSGKRPIDQLNHVRYFVPCLLNTRGLLDDVDLKKRTMPLTFSYPMLVVDTIILQSPWIASADSIKLPASDSISYPEGYLRYRCVSEGDRLVCEVTELWPATVSPESFSKFETYLKSRKKLLDQPVKFYLKNS